MICILILTSLCPGQTNQKKSAAPSEQVARYLSWLPLDTETIIVSQKPWLLQSMDEIFAGEDPTTAEPNGIFYKFVRTIPASLLFWLASGKDTSYFDILKDKQILFAMEGARNFTEPKITGMGTFEGCQLIHFEPGAQDAIVQFMAKCAENAKSTAEHSGTSVHEIEIDAYGQKQNLHVAALESGILLVATDGGYLQELLNRRATKENQVRAFPAELPQWKQVDTGAPLWAIRQYPADRAQSDPSSPRHATPLIGSHDEKASGFAFWFDPSSRRTVNMVHVTESPEPTQAIQSLWMTAHPNLDLEIQQKEQGAWHASVKLNGPEEGGNLYVLILFSLGHMVSI
jgi:hypothetical protein